MRDSYTNTFVLNHELYNLRKQFNLSGAFLHAWKAEVFEVNSSKLKPDVKVILDSDFIKWD